MFVTAINQDANGNLSATSTKAVDTSPIDGFWYSCAGMKSPWNTHMASEEFPPDARFVQERTSWNDLKAKATSPTFAEFKQTAQYFGVDLTDANTDGVPDGDYATFLAAYSPYFAGYPVESGPGRERQRLAQEALRDGAQLHRGAVRDAGQEDRPAHG